MSVLHLWLRGIRNMPANRSAVLAFALVLPLWCGCSEDPQQPSPAPPAIRGDVAGVGFDVPVGWSANADEQDDAVTLSNNAKRGSLVHLRVMTDPENRTVQETVDELADSAASIRRFKLIQNELVTHKRGFEYGLLEYDQSESGMGMVESFAVISLDGNRRLIVSAKAFKRAWVKHKAVFADVVASIELPAE